MRRGQVHDALKSIVSDDPVTSARKVDIVNPGCVFRAGAQGSSTTMPDKAKKNVEGTVAVGVEREGAAQGDFAGGGEGRGEEGLAGKEIGEVGEAGV